NEIQPSSSKVMTWKNQVIKDLKGMHPGNFVFYLESNDEITLNHVSGTYLVGQVYFVKDEPILTYDAYLAQHGNSDVVKSNIEISAKHLYERSDASIRL